MTVRKLFVCTFALIAVIVIASTPLLAAPERLTDQEVKALLESIENKRSAFEAALDTS